MLDDFFTWVLLAAATVMVLALAACVIAAADKFRCSRCRQPIRSGHRDDHGRWLCGRCVEVCRFKPFPPDGGA